MLSQMFDIVKGMKNVQNAMFPKISELNMNVKISTSENRR